MIAALSHEGGDHVDEPVDLAVESVYLSEQHICVAQGIGNASEILLLAEQPIMPLPGGVKGQLHASQPLIQRRDCILGSFPGDLCLEQLAKGGDAPEHGNELIELPLVEPRSNR